MSIRGEQRRWLKALVTEVTAELLELAEDDAALASLPEEDPPAATPTPDAPHASPPAAAADPPPPAPAPAATRAATPPSRPSGSSVSLQPPLRGRSSMHCIHHVVSVCALH